MQVERGTEMAKKKNNKFSTTGPIIYSQRGYKENINLGISTMFHKAWDDKQKVIVI